jgi:hypothetical protein
MIRRSSAWERLQRRWIVGERLDEREERERLQPAPAELEAHRELQFYEHARVFLDAASNEEKRDDARFLDRLLQGASSARGPGLRLVGQVRPAAASEPKRDPRRKPRFPPRVAWLVAATAAAAAITLIARSHWQPLANGAKGPVTGSHAVAVCDLASFSGVVSIGSKLQPSVGQRLAEGATVTTAAGSACLSIDGSVRVCLPSDSAIVLSSLNPRDIRVGVTRGRSIASLSKRTAGAVFSLMGNDVVATAHGTIFTLELRDGPSADVAVLDGSVQVRHGREQALIQSGSRARVGGGKPISVLPNTGSDRTERLSWLGMAEPAAPASARAGTDVPSIEAASRRHGGSAEGVSRDALLAAARAQAKLGNHQAARALYRELVTLYPGPGTAGVQVMLGNLEMELGSPKSALTAFEAYLAAGGALEPEALHGKVRALRALGRKSDERATIRRYLERYPEGFQAPALKQRLADLE